MNHVAVDQAIRSGAAHRVVPALCRLALRDVAEGRREVLGVRHPLGFLCLPLYRDGVHGVCVHIWSALLRHAAATTSTVHSHSWDLASYVLYGRIDNVLVQVKDDPAGGTHRVFEIHSHGDADEVRATQRLVRYRAVRHELAGAGATYTMDAGTFHESVVADGQEAATVALGSVRTAMDLSLGRPDTATHWVTRVRCDPRETAEAATLVLTRLGGETGG
jgi:hypothetical protein